MGYQGVCKTSNWCFGGSEIRWAWGWKARYLSEILRSKWLCPILEGTTLHDRITSWMGILQNKGKENKDTPCELLLKTRHLKLHLSNLVNTWSTIYPWRHSSFFLGFKHGIMAGVYCNNGTCCMGYTWYTSQSWRKRMAFGVVHSHWNSLCHRNHIQLFSASRMESFIILDYLFMYERIWR